MDESSISDFLNEKLGDLPPEVLGEFLSICRLHNIDGEDVGWKWDSYSWNMGPDETVPNLETVRAFKKDVQERMDRESKSKPRAYGANTSKPVQRTPRVAKGSADAMGFNFDDLVSMPRTPRASNGSAKRKFERTPLETPSNKASRHFDAGSPGAALGSSLVSNPFKAGSLSAPSTPFGKRTNAGDIVEVLNEHIPKPDLPLPESSLDADRTAWNARVNLVGNMEVKKFSYRPMHQKLSEASEIQDERIDEFMDKIQEHYEFANQQFGNPSTASPSEIVAVGRIASDMLDGKLSPSSVLLESSRRMGAGSRVRLKLDGIKSYSFFPGQIVAVRGVNASGKYFVVKEILEIPPLDTAVSSVKTLLDTSNRLSAGGLNVFVASGPYTTDDNLHFESLDEICNQAAELCPDILILAGPFIDSQHPLIQTGDFDLEFPDRARDGGTLEDLFREKVAPKIRRVQQTRVILVPSVRDLVSKHVSFPQEPLKRKALDLESNVRCVPNPAVFSVNEIVFAISTNDILFHMAPQEISRKPTDKVPIARLSKHLLSQRSFYPLFPGPSPDQLPSRGTSAPTLDVPSIRLADLIIKPDVLILPSMLTSCVKVVNNVLMVNPGFLSRRMGPGSFASLHVLPIQVEGGSAESGGGEMSHKVYERARVEILRI